MTNSFASLNAIDLESQWIIFVSLTIFNHHEYIHFWSLQFF